MTEAMEMLGPTRVAPPAYGARARAALAPAIRAKMDALEDDAHAAHSIARGINDRLAGVRATAVSIEQQIAMATQVAGTRHVDLDDLRAELADAQQRVARLTVERDEAQVRWQEARRLVEACRAYLGLTS